MFGEGLADDSLQRVTQESELEKFIKLVLLGLHE